jgi:hypothetical protein
MTRTGSDWGGNIVAFAVMIALNAMATSIPLGGKTPPEISAQYPSLFTPAGFTFSIWAVIYLGLLCFVVYQALPAQRRDARLARIDALFKFNCLANAAWILAWHYDYLVLSLLIMAAILLSLVAIYRRLRVPGDEVPPLVRLPFSLYTAWICVATIANISILQTAFGWDDVGMGAVHWTLLKLALAGAVGVSMVTRKSDAAFGLVIAWAAYGISVKQAATPAVAGAALTLIPLTLVLVTLELARRLRLGGS